MSTKSGQLVSTKSGNKTKKCLLKSGKDKVVADIQKADEDYYDYLESRADEYMEDYREDYDDVPGEDSWKIDNLFSSIKQ